jgi:predicted DNA-binding protein (UPF0251 family)
MRRRIAFDPRSTYFKPRGIPLRTLNVETLSREEMEAVRLKDVLGLEQVVAAERMRTSQSTFQRLLASARRKIASALVNGKAIEIASQD